MKIGLVLSAILLALGALIGCSSSPHGYYPRVPNGTYSSGNHAYNNSSQSAHNNDVSDPISAAKILSKNLSSGTFDKKGLRLGLLPLRLRTNLYHCKSLLDPLGEAMQVEFVNTNSFTVIADHEMELVLNRLNLYREWQDMGWVDPSAYKRVGSLLTADLLLDGVITEGPKYPYCQISYKLINLGNFDTGSVISASQIYYNTRP